MGDVSDQIIDVVGRVAAADAADRPALVAAALDAVEAADIETFFHARLTVEAGVEPVGSGLPASPGAASGRLVTTAADAVAAKENGERVILVRPETTPDDVLGMQSAAAIVTMRGGLVSHAAVVARGWGIPAVVGSTDVHVDAGRVTIGGRPIADDEVVTVDGSTGALYIGAFAAAAGEPAPPELDQLLDWADAVALAGNVEVRANADNADDAMHARRFGARGIGLCRTEHMFLAADRLPLMRRFILSDDPAVERDALDQLERAQERDFEAILEAMDELPVTVRLLDPPLHEFLPDLVELATAEARGELDEAGCRELAAVRRMHETNPMIGTRGVRLGIVRPGLYEMQVRALCTAAAALFERGRRPHVEIMIPLVVDETELEVARRWVTGILDEIGHPGLASDLVVVGAMIETPRAAITADLLAPHADFFSFGTNDLTQLTYAFSRDDVESKLMPAYVALGIIDANPFAEIDQAGVGALVRHAVDAARRVSPGIKLGVCGEHAGHPASAAFLIGLGIDSVSCSPYRVPMARLAVARALLATGRVAIDDVDIDVGTSASANAAPATTGSATSYGDEPPGAEQPLDVDEALVLHVLRVRGFVTSAGFEASLGSVPTQVLGPLVDAGHVRFMEARDMYGIMPTGKERAAELLSSSLPDGAVAGLGGPYHTFLTLNDEFKELCTRWQIRNGEPNDHTDADYDAARITELQSLRERTKPVLTQMAAVLPRVSRYVGRLDRAAAAVAAGETKQFTGVMCESFHDVWMELHEDLIVVQGIDRTAEGSY